jgi:hypothetical protein
MAKLYSVKGDEVLLEPARGMPWLVHIPYPDLTPALVHTINLPFNATLLAVRWACGVLTAGIATFDIGVAGDLDKYVDAQTVPSGTAAGAVGELTILDANVDAGAVLVSFDGVPTAGALGLTLVFIPRL